jgi:hypothetical protein
LAKMSATQPCFVGMLFQRVLFHLYSQAPISYSVTVTILCASMCTARISRCFCDSFR